MENEVPDDNLSAAIRKVAESTDLTIAPINKSDSGPAGANVLIRTTEQDRERWRQAANASGITMSAWIRDVLNAAAKELLDCDHPMNMVRFYPWSQICLKCGKRLK
jgi:hypothetical protein